MLPARLAVSCAAALLALAGCAAAPPVAPPAPGCVTAFDPQTDYFPVKAQFEHATAVTLDYERSYRVLTVKQPYPGGAPESYVLLQCGAPRPQLPPQLAGAPVIETPVRSVYAASTTQLPMITDVGALDVLTGVATPDYVSDTAVRARIASGAVRGFATNGQINGESVLAAAPSVLLSQGTEDPAFPALRTGGVPVIGWADYLETGPLAQAEWIKVVGALTGHDAEANRVYDDIARRYADVRAKVAGAPPVPVLLGAAYQGTWRVPQGGGIAGNLVRDAGGTWSQAANPGSGALAQDLETVFAADGQARIWLTDGPLPTKAAVVAADARYGTLAAVRDGQVWTRDRRVGPTGGNDVFERGVTHPDEVLADLAAILHPDRLPGHEFVYYRQATG
ncbi:ABC transporter substrate-binding protein [Pseudonocardia sp. CA-107938]|uniref:ABC transporter substrate-binding protein n=1 Tax=Pseudonocardia sp. CA-107938 TaxID=3240021 RepID=UPI003D8FD551